MIYYRHRTQSPNRTHPSHDRRSIPLLSYLSECVPCSEHKPFRTAPRLVCSDVRQDPPPRRHPPGRQTHCFPPRNNPHPTTGHDRRPNQTPPRRAGCRPRPRWPPPRTRPRPRPGNRCASCSRRSNPPTRHRHCRTGRPARGGSSTAGRRKWQR
uniref:(northern house mosquito) hypothetical protein n=1 Tax=Culex pipiens TaxID=7175 RepID=A0A8D8G1V5_CULPI